MLVAVLAEEGGGVLVRGDGLAGPACLVQDQAEAAQCDALAMEVIGLAEDRGCWCVKPGTIAQGGTHHL